MNFEDICKKIKAVKIQGATNIARAAVVSLSFKNASVKKLISLRPTEPLLRNSLHIATKFGSEKVLNHLDSAEKKIVTLGVKKVKRVVFTHCHSSTVVKILKEAKRKRKKFEVYVTETRPLYQGRITAKELSMAGIKVTEFVDAAARVALEKSDVMLIGADAITNKGEVVNKIGSGMFAWIAHRLKVPVYACTDSWKFDLKTLSGGKEVIEERSSKEVWKNAPSKILIKNPAFEVIKPEFITAIVSELGVLKPSNFVKKFKNKYKWLIKN